MTPATRSNLTDAMCARYEHKKEEAKIKLREKIYVFGAVPRANIRPTDLAITVMMPDED